MFDKNTFMTIEIIKLGKEYVGYLKEENEADVLSSITLGGCVFSNCTTCFHLSIVTSVIHQKMLIISVLS